MIAEINDAGSGTAANKRSPLHLETKYVEEFHRNLLKLYEGMTEEQLERAMQVLKQNEINADDFFDDA